MNLRTILGPKPAALLISVVVLPLIMLLAVLSYSWPAGRIAPRDLPVGVVSTNPAAEQIALGLQQKNPGAFDVTLYGSDAAARGAIQNREIYGAFDVAPGRLTAFTTSAASSTVAQLITQVADNIAAQSAAHGKPLTVTTDDVVPASAGDPHGAVLSSALVPLTVCSVILAAASSVFLRLRPAWRHITVLAVLSALSAVAAYVITQCFLGAFPGRHLETWATLALLIFSVCSAVAGSIALIGPVAVGLGAALFVFVGIPFAGTSSAPEMLPKSADVIGQLLPPGAGQSLLRNTAFFDGHGPLSHLMVLIAWSLFGILADIVGHHSLAGFAARRHHAAARNANQAAQHLGASTGAHIAAADLAEPGIDSHGTAQFPVETPAHSAAHAAAHAAHPGHHAATYAEPPAPAQAAAPGPFPTSTPYSAPAPHQATAPRPDSYRSTAFNPFARPTPPPLPSHLPPAPAPDQTETQATDGTGEPWR